MSLDTFLPEGLSLAVGLALVAASVVTSFISAAFGLGGGVTLLALMAVLLPPSVLVPIHGAIQIGSNAGRALVTLRYVAGSAMIPFAIGSLVGAMLGGLIAVRIPPYAVELAIGLFILWSVYGRLPAFGRHALITGGAFSSFLTMFFGATGPFVVTIVRGLGLQPLGVVATHAAFMTIQHVVKVAVFGVLGFAFAPYLPLVLAMIVSGLIGTVIGKSVLTRYGHYYFRIGLNTVLTVAALRLIWSGLSALFGF